MRIVILGCAGSGKTTLARRLGKLTGAPVICLDEIRQPHWTAKDVPVFRTLIERAHAGNRWISDGNFAEATFDIRLPRATQIVWLERSKLFCVWHSIARTFKRGEAHGMTRLFHVLRFIWKFDKINRPKIESARSSCAPHLPVCRLTNNAEIDGFLLSMSPRASLDTGGVWPKH
jgi:adenylate kinase family enzyme